MQDKSNEIVIIDTDAGADDAIAVYLALKSKLAQNVKALTAVTGNAQVDDVVVNLIKTLGTAGFEVPIYKGMRTPWSGHIYSDGYFGNDGFGDFDYDGPLNKSLIQKVHAVDFMIDLVKKHPKQVTIICIAPLTNIAEAGKRFSDFYNLVNKLIILGGNSSPESSIEFNMKADTKAANFVFDHLNDNCSAVVIPYELFTGKNTFPLEYRKNVLGKIDNKIVQLFNNAERISFTKTNEWRTPDELAAAYWFQPDIVTSSTIGKPFVDPDTGRMIILEGKTANIILSVDMKKMKNIIFNSFERF
ncbi:uridine nucleosidase 1-like isoform X2 [Cimex lectularius]|uniref:Inosine/uridine-preferring nucleoside hydrolase domain-containing protein n=1 Tax=Cimex lectularius TaxID=79782 RepID=A0A8I6S689_CIMLE|nr:uridine nucleosidase 1-like isoform X2 [Cimex lectularius]